MTAQPPNSSDWSPHLELGEGLTFQNGKTAFLPLRGLGQRESGGKTGPELPLPDQDRDRRQISDLGPAPALSARPTPPSGPPLQVQAQASSCPGLFCMASPLSGYSPAPHPSQPGGEPRTPVCSGRSSDRPPVSSSIRPGAMLQRRLPVRSQDPGSFTTTGRGLEHPP